MKSYKELMESLVTEEKFQGEEVMFRHGDFIITKRNTMGMRGKQDPYHAWIIKDGKPEVWGSHPAGVEGLKKAGRHHGLLKDGVEEIGNSNLMPIYEDQEDLEMSYDALDELNKDTLLSYYYKAGHEKSDPKKGEKRKKGTERALNKIVDKTMEEGTMKSDRTGQRVEAKMTSPWKKDETYIGKVVKTFTRGGSIMTHTIKLDDGKTVDVNETEIVKVLKDK